MGQIIAIAGKGGTGKTTLAALAIRTLVEKGAGSVLAIDADPNANLGDMLGVKRPSTIVEIIDDISKNPDQIPKGMSKDIFIDLKVQEALNEEKGFDLLTMGRPEGPGCYCFANNMLRELIMKLMKGYEYIVIDNEAGMEHLSRRLLRRIDTLFVISDSTVVGLRSATRISDLVNELNIEAMKRFLILNKCKKESSESLRAEVGKTGLLLKVSLPFNEELEESSIKNRSVFEIDDANPVLAAIKDILILPVAKKG